MTTAALIGWSRGDNLIARPPSTLTGDQRTKNALIPTFAGDNPTKILHYLNLIITFGFSPLFFNKSIIWEDETAIFPSCEGGTEMTMRHDATQRQQQRPVKTVNSSKLLVTSLRVHQAPSGWIKLTNSTGSVFRKRHFFHRLSTFAYNRSAGITCI